MVVDFAIVLLVLLRNMVYIPDTYQQKSAYDGRADGHYWYLEFDGYCNRAVFSQHSEYKVLCVPPRIVPYWFKLYDY